MAGRIVLSRTGERRAGAVLGGPGFRPSVLARRSTAMPGSRRSASTTASGTGSSSIAGNRVRERIAEGFPGWASRLGRRSCNRHRELRRHRRNGPDLRGRDRDAWLGPALDLRARPEPRVLRLRSGARLPPWPTYPRWRHVRDRFSGYPDCRDATLRALGEAIRLGTEMPFTIETPLMGRTKAETWALADTLGGDAFVDLITEETHTCYRGERSLAP